MHVIITGGAGFIGSQTAESLLKRGDTVSVIDAFDFGYDPIHKEHNISLLSKIDGFRLYHWRYSGSSAPTTNVHRQNA